MKTADIVEQSLKDEPYYPTLFRVIIKDNAEPLSHTWGGIGLVPVGTLGSVVKVQKNAYQDANGNYTIDEYDVEWDDYPLAYDHDKSHWTEAQRSQTDYTKPMGWKIKASQVTKLDNAHTADLVEDAINSLTMAVNREDFLGIIRPYQIWKASNNLSKENYLHLSSDMSVDTESADYIEITGKWHKFPRPLNLNILNNLEQHDCLVWDNIVNDYPMTLINPDSRQSRRRTTNASDIASNMPTSAPDLPLLEPMYADLVEDALRDEQLRIGDMVRIIKTPIFPTYLGLNGMFGELIRITPLKNLPISIRSHIEFEGILEDTLIYQVVVGFVFAYCMRHQLAKVIDKQADLIEQSMGATIGSVVTNIDEFKATVEPYQVWKFQSRTPGDTAIYAHIGRDFKLSFDSNRNYWIIYDSMWSSNLVLNSPVLKTAYVWLIGVEYPGTLVGYDLPLKTADIVEQSLEDNAPIIAHNAEEFRNLVQPYQIWQCKSDGAQMNDYLHIGSDPMVKLIDGKIELTAEWADNDRPYYPNILYHNWINNYDYPLTLVGSGIRKNRQIASYNDVNDVSDPNVFNGYTFSDINLISDDDAIIPHNPKLADIVELSMDETYPIGTKLTYNKDSWSIYMIVDILPLKDVISKYEHILPYSLASSFQYSKFKNVAPSDNNLFVWVFTLVGDRVKSYWYTLPDVLDQYMRPAPIDTEALDLDVEASLVQLSNHIICNKISSDFIDGAYVVIFEVTYTNGDIWIYSVPFDSREAYLYFEKKYEHNIGKKVNVIKQSATKSQKVDTLSTDGIEHTSDLIEQTLATPEVVNNMAEFIAMLRPYQVWKSSGDPDPYYLHIGPDASTEMVNSMLGSIVVTGEWTLSARPLSMTRLKQMLINPHDCIVADNVDDEHDAHFPMFLINPDVRLKKKADIVEQSLMDYDYIQVGDIVKFIDDKVKIMNDLGWGMNFTPSALRKVIDIDGTEIYRVGGKYAGTMGVIFLKGVNVDDLGGYIPLVGWENYIAIVEKSSPKTADLVEEVLGSLEIGDKVKCISKSIGGKSWSNIEGGNEILNISTISNERETYHWGEHDWDSIVLRGHPEQYTDDMRIYYVYTSANDADIFLEKDLVLVEKSLDTIASVYKDKLMGYDKARHPLIDEFKEDLSPDTLYYYKSNAKENLHSMERGAGIAFLYYVPTNALRTGNGTHADLFFSMSIKGTFLDDTRSNKNWLSGRISSDKKVISFWNPCEMSHDQPVVDVLFKLIKAGKLNKLGYIKFVYDTKTYSLKEYFANTAAKDDDRVKFSNIEASADIVEQLLDVVEVNSFAELAANIKPNQIWQGQPYKYDDEQIYLHTGAKPSVRFINTDDFIMVDTYADNGIVGMSIENAIWNSSPTPVSLRITNDHCVIVTTIKAFPMILINVNSRKKTADIVEQSLYNTLEPGVRVKLINEDNLAEIGLRGYYLGSIDYVGNIFSNDLYPYGLNTKYYRSKGKVYVGQCVVPLEYWYEFLEILEPTTSDLIEQSMEIVANDAEEFLQLMRPGQVWQDADPDSAIPYLILGEYAKASYEDGLLILKCGTWIWNIPSILPFISNNGRPSIPNNSYPLLLIDTLNVKFADLVNDTLEMMEPPKGMVCNNIDEFKQYMRPNQIWKDINEEEFPSAEPYLHIGLNPKFRNENVHGIIIPFLEGAEWNSDTIPAYVDYQFGWYAAMSTDSFPIVLINPNVKYRRNIAP